MSSSRLVIVRVLAAGVVLALLALLLGLQLRGATSSAARDRALMLERHTFVVLIEAERVEAALRGAEAAQRGWLLTRDGAFRRAFDARSDALAAAVARLRALTADNPAQRASLSVLDASVRERLAGMRARAGAPPGRAFPLPLRADVDRDFERSLATVRFEEQRLLAARRAMLDREEARVNRVRLASGALAVGLLAAAAAVGVLAYRGLTRARRAAAAARRAAAMRAMLEAQVAERTAELEATNESLREAAETRERAQSDLRQLQKMEAIGQLTGGVAHDFNNMLAIVIGSLDMAKRRLDSDPERARALIGNAEEGAQRAAQLTRKLLAFARRQSLAPEPTDVNALVVGTAELIRRTIGDAVALETLLDAGAWPASVDRAELETAVLNLAVNARDALPDGRGRITIETGNVEVVADDAVPSTLAAGAYVQVSVGDDGCGMPADVLARAFDPFFTTKPVGKGTGLGLSQVYGFARQSGGDVRIESQPGRGTTVRLLLPRAAVAAAPVAAAGEPNALPRARAGETVLVVEDEPRVRRTSAEALRLLGYEVLEAPGVTDAVAALERTRRVDLVFSDVLMPGADGYELARRVRARWPDTRVLLTTGFAGGAASEGAPPLAKPFSVRALAERVRAALDDSG